MIVVALDPGEDWATATFLDGMLKRAMFQGFPVAVAGNTDVVVVEMPVCRPGGAPSNKVVRIAFHGGIPVGSILRVNGKIPHDKIAEVPTVAVPKYVIDRRVRVALAPFEAAVLDSELVSVPKSKRNNVIDAVRHGLVYLGRMSR